MSSLVHKLGLSAELSWHDVYSLDDPSLLAFVPRPAHALLLVFPVSTAYEKARTDEDSSSSDYAGTGSGEEVLWFKQTIGNACGLMGIIHATCNGMTRDLIGMTASSSSSYVFANSEQRLQLLFPISSPKPSHLTRALVPNLSKPPMILQPLMPLQLLKVTLQPLQPKIVLICIM